MLYFTWGINKPDVKDQRIALIRTHWDFIAAYDKYLIARGPVMHPNDLSVVIGSIHIIELPGLAEAEDFVYNEPFAKAGLFGSIILSRFELELERTQFEFVSNPDFPRFFVYCPSTLGHKDKTPELTEAHKKYCKDFDKAFICCGSILSNKGQWQGQIYFFEFPDKRNVDSFFRNEPYARSNLYDHIDISRWTMGGPENLDAKGALS